MALEYLTAAANEMFLTLAGTVTPDISDLRRVASLGCNTLRQIVIDQEFLVSVVNLSLGRSQYSEDFDDITGKLTGSLEHFSYFLDTERKVMLEAGFDTHLVEELIQQARMLIVSIRAWEGDPRAFLAIAAQVRDQACQLATSLTNELEHVQQQEILTHGLRRVTYAVAGAAIIVLNASVPFPLSVAGATVSGAFGSALIGTALASG